LFSARAALIESPKKITTLETTNEPLRERVAELEFTQKTQHKAMMNMDEDLAEIKAKLGIKEKFRPD
jgi:hypothetical protein